MGVWIETFWAMPKGRPPVVTPFVGVWIETFWAMPKGRPPVVTPFVGVWIETAASAKLLQLLGSHPSWVCGLKQLGTAFGKGTVKSHPSWVCGLKPYNPLNRDA